MSAAFTTNPELWSSLGFWMLVAGLVGDVAVLTIPKHWDRFEKILSAFFTIVIIAGVAIEHRADSDISRATDIKIAGLERDAAEFKQKAADAGVVASQAVERAAKAEKATEDERIERLKLEKQVAPRRLTAEQQNAIADSLKQFKGRKVNLVSYSLDVEAGILAYQIKPALQRAGLLVDDKISQFLTAGPGILLGIHINGPLVEKEFVMALANSLTKNGKLLFSGIRADSFPGADAAQVNIFVGAKPPSDADRLLKK
jgi:hypothetical protein